MVFKNVWTFSMGDIWISSIGAVKHPGVEKMAYINRMEVERRRGYWQHALSKIERTMLQLQSERVDIQHRLVHLNSLRKQAEMTG